MISTPALGIGVSNPAPVLNVTEQTSNSSVIGKPLPPTPTPTQRRVALVVLNSRVSVSFENSFGEKFLPISLSAKFSGTN